MMSAYSAEPQRLQLHPFLRDVAEIRRRARLHIREGTGARGENAGRITVLRLLNTALATELVCALRYRRYSAMQAQVLDEGVKNEFVKRAQEEQSHADQISARIVELGGEPNPHPHGAPYQADGVDDGEIEDLADMLAEDLIAERIAIDTYREIIRYLGDTDMATQKLFEAIVAVEQEHAAGFASMREQIRCHNRAPVGANHNGPVVEDTP
jgi:bacterioferritin